MKNYNILIFVSLFFITCKSDYVAQKEMTVQQVSLARVNQMPEIPSHFKILDFKNLAKRFDSIVYDTTQTSKYWPLLWFDNSRKNFNQETFGIYTAIGDLRQGTTHYKGIFHESLATIGSVLGASLVGVNKQNQHGKDFVGMLKNYFNSDTKWDIVMNNTSPEVAKLGGGYARDWWYDVYPNILFYGVASFYPNEKDYSFIMKSVADKFYKADSVMAGNYHHSFFNYATLTPKDSWICKQEDAAAGHSYVLYAAFQKFKNPKYLKGAKSSLKALLGQKDNRFYEILMPFGAYVAARLNAEEGTNYDYTKILDWTFNGTPDCRKGWGVLVDNWNGYDVSGLVGSTVDHGGFAFLMNTYDTMWPLVPMVRYDSRYANAIGKWMLNASNAIKLFYPYEISDNHQTIPELKAVTKGVIAYEGLIKKAHFKKYEKMEAPVAIGDGPHWVKGNPDVSQFGVYGSGHVGIAGAIIETTNIPTILKLNCLATDFYRKEAYPTFLLYNPNKKEKLVNYKISNDKKVNLFDAISHKVIAKRVNQSKSIIVSAKSSVLIVEIPVGAKIIFNNGKYYANNVVVAYM